MSFTWIILFAVLILIEIFTINLVSIWFAIGALTSFLVSLLTDSTWIQILTFILVSIITLLLTKKIVSKLKDKEVTPTNLDRVIGTVGLVTKKISLLEPGEVKAGGKMWSAISNENIDINTEVKILSIEGVKLIVKKVEEEK